MEDNSYAEDSIKVGSKKKPKKKKQMDTGKSKELLQYIKSNGEEAADEFLMKSSEELRNNIVYCLVQIAETTEELEANVEYQRVKEDLKILLDGLKETIKPFKDAVLLATSLLRERGESIPKVTVNFVDVEK
jgi:hypothetical protein